MRVPAESQSPSCPVAQAATRTRPHRFIPIAIVALAMIAVFATGAYRHVSLETLEAHRQAIDHFIATHGVVAVGAYMLLYICAVALSIPGAILLTMTGGILFGTLIGGAAAVVSATIGATLVFLIARYAGAEALLRRTGPLAAKIADGFCADAFSYLLFLRLFPVVPFFLVNLAPALVGVKLRVFVLATAIGVVPATFAFAFFGDGLESVLAASIEAYRQCVAAGGADCHLRFDLGMIATPRVIAALAILAAFALAPVVVRRLRARAASARSAPAA